MECTHILYGCIFYNPLCLFNTKNLVVWKEFCTFAHVIEKQIV